MPVTPSDLAQQWSTRFETLYQTEYNQSIAVAEEQMRPLINPIPLNDNEGNQVQLDWLGAAPQMRTWLDEKRPQGLNKYAYSVVVSRYEASVEVDMDAFRDARFNVYDLRIREMARNAARLPYNLVSDLIANGQTKTGYDAKNFFDTTHQEGASGVQSNKLTGTGTTQAQVEADYYAAKSALMGFKDDQGVVMGPTDFRPIVWLPNNATMIQRFAILAGAQMNNNTSNILAGKFDIVVDPRLTDPNDWGMFRPDLILKPFIVVSREDPHYEDNFDSRADDVFKRRKGIASAVGRMAAAYGMWQCAAWTTNA